jgi:hypothetical protein
LRGLEYQMPSEQLAPDNASDLAPGLAPPSAAAASIITLSPSAVCFGQAQRQTTLSASAGFDE